MTKLKIFDHIVHKYKIPHYLYNNSNFKEDLKKIFYLDSVQNNKVDQLFGNGLSTCGLGQKYVMDLLNFDILTSYVTKIILNKYYNNEYKKIIYYGMWVNIVNFGAEVSCHTHDEDKESFQDDSTNNSGGSAIFYYKVPKNSGDLVILKHATNSVLRTKDKEISHNIKLEEGDLIIFSENCPHAVSKSTSDESRISFIFNFKPVD